MARATLDYARAAHAARGHLADTAGAIATAACQGAHGVLAARGEWVTNEKTLLDRAGLRGADGILADLSPEPGRLVQAVDAAAGQLRAALDAARGTGPAGPGRRRPVPERRRGGAALSQAPLLPEGRPSRSPRGSG